MEGCLLAFRSTLVSPDLVLRGKTSPELAQGEVGDGPESIIKNASEPIIS